MSEEKLNKEDIQLILVKLSEVEQRIDILHESIKDTNSAIDMLVRFSMTAKAFMELSISHGIIDPNELNNLASQYETNYSDNLNMPNSEIEYRSKFEKNMF